MLAPVTHILPLTTIRRERILRSPGKVLVRKGQKVSANDTIAEASLAPEHLILDIVRGLGVPADKADSYIQVKAGDSVAAGDIVAGPVGISRRVVRSIKDGRVVLAGSGQVLIELKSQPFELKAGIPGEVIDLLGDQGAIIQTTGALIQGVWGNGPVDYGLLTLLAKSADDIFTPERLDVSMRGAVALAGWCSSAEALKTAADLPLRGLILSSMDPVLIPIASKIPIPIIVMEGFGQRPMNSIAYQLLSTSERREVALNAEPWDRYARTRPEVVIPLPATGELRPPSETAIFATGQQVRVLRPPHAGKVGILGGVGHRSILPNGLRALTAEVRLEDGESVVLPLANLEVLV